MSYLDNPNWFEIVLNGLFTHNLMSRHFRNFAESLELTGDETVLDFGGGSGPLSRHIAEFLLSGSGDGRVTILDPTKKWMNIAKKRLSKFPNVDFIQGDISSLDGRVEQFDIITIHFMLHDLDKGIRQEIINALSRLLKDKGRIFIREPMREGHGMPPGEIRDLMTNAGLTEIHCDEASNFFVGPIFTAAFGR